MSKSITIPTNCNPYIVVINNNVYTYKAGETVEVPDEVAEAIEDAIELAPKPKRYISKLAQLAEGNITELTFNDLEGIENIAYCAFTQCYSLTRVEIPNSVKKIKESALTGCIKLESVIFGEDSRLDSIAKNAFYYCTNLARVHLPLNPPTLEDVSAFADIKADCVFYCKTQASKDAYLSATNWSTLAGTYSFVVEE